MKFGFDLKLEWNELKRFENLSESERSIVFYAENEFYYIYLKSILEELIKKYQLNICYVTSSKSDPLLKNENENIKSFYIGEGTVRTKFFLNFHALNISSDEMLFGSPAIIAIGRELPTPSNQTALDSW